MESFLNLSNLILSSKAYFPPQKGSKKQQNRASQNIKDINFLKQYSLHTKFVKKKPNIQQQKLNSKRQNNRKYEPVIRHDQIFYEPQDSFTMIDSLQLNLQVQRIDQTEPTKSIFSNYIGCCSEKKFNSQKFKCIATKNRQMFIHNLNNNQLQIFINFNTVQASITSNFWDSSCWNTMCSVKQQKKTIKSRKQLAWQHKYVVQCLMKYRLDFDGKLTLSFTSTDGNSEVIIQWGQYLKSIIQQSYGKLYNLSNLTQNQDFYKKKFKLERQFLDDCQTGDLILFQGKNMMAKAQRFFTNSQFDHVGMVVRDKYYNVLVFQTNGISGSCLTPWNMIVSYECYKTIDKIVWRKLEGVERTFEFQKKIANFIKQNIKTKYHLSIKKLLSDKSYNGLEKNEEHGYFCSELIARIYKQMHLLPNSENQPNYKPACHYLPYDFTQKAKLQLTKGASLSGQYELLFDQVGLINNDFQGTISNDNKIFKKQK